MAMPHAASGDLIDLHSFGANLRQSVSATLVRSDHLEIFRMVLVAGNSLPIHQVPSVVTVQCLEGAVELAVRGRSQVMHEGNLVYLSAGEPHALRAIEDSSILITMLVHRK